MHKLELPDSSQNLVKGYALQVGQIGARILGCLDPIGSTFIEIAPWWRRNWFDCSLIA
jgi:hypothetical protein